jgi:hypothetical protein
MKLIPGYEIHHLDLASGSITQSRGEFRIFRMPADATFLVQVESFFILDPIY